MMTNIVDCDLDAVRIGDAVRLVFKYIEHGKAVVESCRWLTRNGRFIRIRKVSSANTLACRGRSISTY